MKPVLEVKALTHTYSAGTPFEHKAIEDVNQLKQAYQKEGDCALYSDVPTTFVDLLPGQFAIVYPEDPHAPVIGEGKIRKLIAKVKI